MSQTNSWLLTGARVALGPQDAAEMQLQIEAGHRRFLRTSTLHHDLSPLTRLNLTGMLILPGLINAHDHLEFALFPRLGTRTYTNAREWAMDIYHPEKSPLRELLQVPKPSRLFWGGLKNLLCGVTTVCHHNEYEPEIFENRFPVRVLKAFGWSHSFVFSGDVKADFERAPDGGPFFIHLAEGADDASRDELRRLDELGLLNNQTVIVHGVALVSQDWELVRQRGTRVVWCPSSNLFTLGKTLDVDSLPSGIEVVLGNDSPLTAAGDLLDEIRIAHQVQGSGQIPAYEGGRVSQARGGCRADNTRDMPSAGHPPQAVACSPLPKGEFSSLKIEFADQLYHMVTTWAAHVMRLHQGEGSIAEASVADLVVVRDTGCPPAQRLVELSAADIELVMIKGEIMLASARLASQLSPTLLNGMQSLTYNQQKYSVALDIQPHWEVTCRILGDNFRLAGKEIRIGMR